MTGKYLGILVWQTRRVIAPTTPLRGRRLEEVGTAAHRLFLVNRIGRRGILRERAAEMRSESRAVHTCVRRCCGLSSRLEQLVSVARG